VEGGLFPDQPTFRRRTASELGVSVPLHRGSRLSRYRDSVVSHHLNVKDWGRARAFKLMLCWKVGAVELESPERAR
jgi:hypothetical protein